MKDPGSYGTGRASPYRSNTPPTRDDDPDDPRAYSPTPQGQRHPKKKPRTGSEPPDLSAAVEASKRNRSHERHVERTGAGTPSPDAAGTAEPKYRRGTDPSRPVSRAESNVSPNPNKKLMLKYMIHEVRELKRQLDPNATSEDLEASRRSHRSRAATPRHVGEREAEPGDDDVFEAPPTSPAHRRRKLPLAPGAEEEEERRSGTSPLRATRPYKAKLSRHALIEALYK
jgi:hypothetical protein